MTNSYCSNYIFMTLPTVTATEKIAIVTFPGIGAFFAPSAEIQRLIHGERANLTLYPLPGGSA